MGTNIFFLHYHLFGIFHILPLIAILRDILSPVVRVQTWVKCDGQEQKLIKMSEN